MMSVARTARVLKTAPVTMGANPDGIRVALAGVRAASGVGRADTASTCVQHALQVLMTEVLEGNADAFTQLYKKLAPRVMSMLTEISGDRCLAEDLTQVTFTKLYRARDRYQPGLPIVPWIFAIARNSFLDHRRSAWRRAECLTADGTLPEIATEELPEVFKAVSRDDLNAALQMLTEPQRRAVLLLQVQGLSIAAAAAICDTSPASIKMRSQRAQRALRAALSERARR